MAKRELAVHLVSVPTPGTRLREVPGFHEVGDDVRRASLGDSDGRGDVFESQRRVGGDAREHMRVIRDEAPTVVAVTRTWFHESMLV